MKTPANKPPRAGHRRAAADRDLHRASALSFPSARSSPTPTHPSAVGAEDPRPAIHLVASVPPPGSRAARSRASRFGCRPSSTTRRPSRCSLRGEADLLFTGTSQGWENRLGRKPHRDDRHGRLGRLVARRAGTPSIRGFADLKGKRLALPFPGAPLDFQTRAILAHDGDRPRPGPHDQLRRLRAERAAPARGQARRGGASRAARHDRREDQGARAPASATPMRGRSATGDARVAPGEPVRLRLWARAHGTLRFLAVAAWQAASAQGAVRRRATSPRGSPPPSPPIAASLEESARNTLFDVPDLAVNKARVVEYYQQVARYLPGRARQLDDGFFFAALT